MPGRLSSPAPRLLGLAAAGLATLGSIACKPAPPQAPTDLGDLSLFFFREFESGDEALLQDGAGNLRDFFLGHDTDGALAAESERDGRTWSIPILEREDMGGVAIPDEVDPLRQLPVAVAMRSAYSLAEHLAIIALSDQTPVEPESSAEFTREFDSDVGCFVAGDCPTLLCRDTIHRQNLLLDLVYVQQTDFRRIELPDGSGDAVIARSYLEEMFSEEGADPETIEQWSAVTARIEDGATTLRYNTLWGSSSLNDDLEEDFLLNQVADGMEEGFQNTDAYLADE
jgi:hypothetical protein